MIINVYAPMVQCGEHSLSKSRDRTKTKPYNISINAHKSESLIDTYIASIVFNHAYIVSGIDVGSPLAQQSHHLGVTLKSRYGQGGVPSLSKAMIMTTL